MQLLIRVLLSVLLKKSQGSNNLSHLYPDSKDYGANNGPIWGRQDPGGPHIGSMNFAIWVNRLSHPFDLRVRPHEMKCRRSKISTKHSNMTIPHHRAVYSRHGTDIYIQYGVMLMHFTAGINRIGFKWGLCFRGESYNTTFYVPQL